LANYNSLTMEEARTNLGRILKQQRVSLPLTLRDLSAMSGVSASHLGRIERGERFPSGSVLRKIAGPLGFEEDELFTLAGYLSPQQAGVAESRVEYGSRGDLDPYVARVLAQEPVDVQRAVIGILSILNSIAKTSAREKKS
jgi:transcriptional regulator with XRE-family HTH domain